MRATRAEVRRLVLVALLALTAQSLLPYLHANTSFEKTASTSHSSADCAVCSALAHGGARALDTPVALSFAPAAIAVSGLCPAPAPSAAAVDPDSACARAPPAHRLA
jgi:hypothetical protein